MVEVERRAACLMKYCRCDEVWSRLMDLRKLRTLAHRGAKQWEWVQSWLDVRSQADASEGAG